MIIKTVVVGPLQVNCYIVGDEKTGRAMVVDPGDEPDRILDLLRKNNLIVDYIVCTHGHFDHVGAVGDVKKETNAKIVQRDRDHARVGRSRPGAGDRVELDVFYRNCPRKVAGCVHLLVFGKPCVAPERDKVVAGRRRADDDLGRRWSGDATPNATAIAAR